MKPTVWALTISAAFAFGCGDDNPSAPEFEVYRPQNSIENVLHNLIQAYERQDIVAYEKLFAKEFYFVFDPQDVAENPDTPDEWGISDDVASTGNMFDEPLVENIILDFVVDSPTAATPADELNHSFPTGTMKTVVSEVELGVDTRDPKGGENIIYQVVGDQAIFFLFPHPTETIQGLPVWYILEWRDRKIGSFAGGLASARVLAFFGELASPTGERQHGNTAPSVVTVETSWGSIKSVFRF